MKFVITLLALVSLSAHAKLQTVCTNGENEGWPRSLSVDIEPFNKAIVIEEGSHLHRNEIESTYKQNDAETLKNGASMIGELKPLKDVTVYNLKTESEIIEGEEFVRLTSFDGRIFYGFGHDQSGFYSSSWCH